MIDFNDTPPDALAPKRDNAVMGVILLLVMQSVVGFVCGLLLGALLWR